MLDGNNLDFDMAPPNATPGKYDLVIIGGSGFTGTIICMHIAARFPTNLKWSIAGRSQERLDRVAEKLRGEYPDRVQPELEIVAPDDERTLGEIIGRASVCISTTVCNDDGDAIVRACIERRTDYVDSAAVPTLLRGWVAKYQEQAKEAGVALIHSCGAMTGEMDIFAMIGSREIARKWSTRMGNMTLRADDLEYAPLRYRAFMILIKRPNVGGGTLRSMLAFARGGPKLAADAANPSLLTLSPYTKPIQAVSGIHCHPLLGLLSNPSPPGDQARTSVNRPWSLLGGADGRWGPNFQYNEYERAASNFAAVGNLVRCYLILTLFSFVRFRWFHDLLMRSATLGVGRTDEQIKTLPFRATCYIDADIPGQKQGTKGCLIKMKYPDGGSPFAAMPMAQTAATLIYDRHLEAGIKRGYLMPAALGYDFVERTRTCGGLQIDTTIIDT
ncbi:LOW QUALITY PROTEIN: Lipid droplet localized protein [Paramyrothecium foliicola]|nr:LOW QUALITY PROTEIN: Lipid droplet localized protein [Paramyrothecium foliicola]